MAEVNVSPRKQHDPGQGRGKAWAGQGLSPLLTVSFETMGKRLPCLSHPPSEGHE